MDIIEDLKSKLTDCDKYKLYTINPVANLLKELYILSMGGCEKELAAQIKYELEGILITTPADIISHYFTKGRMSVRIQDLIVQIISRISEYAIDASKYIKEKASDFLDVRRYNMTILSNNPILKYTCRELMSKAMPLFLVGLVEMDGYSDEIFKYWQLLELRGHQLMHSSNSELHDVPIYSENGNGKKVSLEFIRQLSTVSRGVRDYFASHSVLPHFPPQSPVSPIYRKNLIEWIKAQSVFLTGDMTTARFRDNFIQRCLRIGEIEAYTRKNPGSIPTPTGALKSLRVYTQYLFICQEASTSISELVETHIDKKPESLHVRCIITEVMQSYMYTKYGLDWETFIIHQKSIDSRHLEFFRVDYPIIVETCSRHQLAYKGECIEYNSYLDSLIAWLTIVKTNLNGIVTHVDISAFINLILHNNAQSSS